MKKFWFLFLVFSIPVIFMNAAASMTARIMYGNTSSQLGQVPESLPVTSVVVGIILAALIGARRESLGRKTVDRTPTSRPKLELVLFFLDRDERDDALGDFNQDYEALLKTRSERFARTAYVFMIIGFFWRRSPHFVTRLVKSMLQKYFRVP